MTWNQIESKLAIALTLFIALVFVGTLLVFIAEEYGDTPRYVSRRQGTVRKVNQAPHALKPHLNDLELPINQSLAHEPALTTQFVQLQRQELGQMDDDPTMANNREPNETSHLDTSAIQVAVHPARSINDALEEEKQKVVQSIETWRRAWQAQDVDTYIARYTEAFQPANGHSHQAWLEDRQIKLTQAKTISVQVNHLQVQQLDDQQWKATFHQRYESNTYSDKVTKELLLIKVGDQYLIAKEQVL